VKFSSYQKILSEFIGTFLLVLTVVGSGIMGETLSDDKAIALLGNTIATGAILYVLISMFINISGAYFNPAVVLADLIQKNISINLAIIFVVVQCIGGVLGCMTANWYFEYPVYEWSNNDRSGIYKFVSEIIAAFGLVITILILKKVDKTKIAIGVALFITAGYWFTSSTSFANPAVTVGRMFTDTFSGIHPNSVVGFIFAQFIGAILATYFSKILINKN
jgi:glycerol uptake facilitator-like aquaporin